MKQNSKDSKKKAEEAITINMHIIESNIEVEKDAFTDFEKQSEVEILACESCLKMFTFHREKRKYVWWLHYQHHR